MRKITIKNQNKEISKSKKFTILHFSLKDLFPSLKISVLRCYIDGDTCYLEVCSDTKSAICPYCGKKSEKCHSWYTRILHDLPISEFRVKIIFRIRKFFCTNDKCSKKTFAEQPSEEIQPYQRNTQRFKKIISL